MSRAFPLRVFAGAIVATTLVGALPSEAATDWRKPADVAGFSGLRTELQRLANTYGTSRVNRFCAVVRDVREPRSATSEGDDQALIVHWQQGQRLYSYGPSKQGRIGPLNQDTGAAIDLAHDVVVSEKQIDGSVKRVTRAYVNGILRHCRAGGTRFTILREAGKPRATPVSIR